MFLTNYDGDDEMYHVQYFKELHHIESEQLTDTVDVVTQRRWATGVIAVRWCLTLITC